VLADHLVLLDAPSVTAPTRPVPESNCRRFRRPPAWRGSFNGNRKLISALLDATTRTVVASRHSSAPAATANHAPSLTWDRRIEMTRHADFTAATGIPVYFCDAYCPWQCGSNEKSNGLLRQYFPKKTDLPTRRRSRPSRGQRAQQPNSTPGMANSSRGLLGRHRCDDRLRPQPTTGQFSAAVDRNRLPTALQGR
jgi:hypothetical protein